MMSKREAEQSIKAYWLSLPPPVEYTPLTAMEFYNRVKKERPDLLEYPRRKDYDQYQEIKSWVWEYIGPHLMRPDR